MSRPEESMRCEKQFRANFSDIMIASGFSFFFPLVCALLFEITGALIPLSL
ncbi:MAG: hypothetical protein R6U96_01225 [Promethearchaeia archaeon]